MKLDFGCGPHKQDGFEGVDIIAFDGVDHVLDIRQAPWKWEDESVEEAYASHFLEHLDADERIAFFNELYRVMKPEGKITIVTPHWRSGRAYGDLTHKWPPVVEFFWYYLNKDWRKDNAPHVPLTCHFEGSWSWNINYPWTLKNQDALAFAVNHYSEVASDMIATLIKR